MVGFVWRKVKHLVLNQCSLWDANGSEVVWMLQVTAVFLNRSSAHMRSRKDAPCRFWLDLVRAAGAGWSMGPICRQWLHWTDRLNA